MCGYTVESPLQSCGTGAKAGGSRQVRGLYQRGFQDKP